MKFLFKVLWANKQEYYIYIYNILFWKKVKFFFNCHGKRNLGQYKKMYALVYEVIINICFANPNSSFVTKKENLPYNHKIFFKLLLH